MKVWFLEGLSGPRKAMQRVRMTVWPFVVGREPSLPLILDSPGISRMHAQLEPDGDTLVVRDLGSTNGTFVNRRRVDGTAALRHGDILHFAAEEFRVVADERLTRANLKLTVEGIADLPENLPGGGAQLHELLLNGLATAAFQPIVNPADQSVFAYEMLGRGIHPELPDSPAALFRIAESLGTEIQLSELLRDVGMDLAHRLDPNGRFFTNIHPAELDAPERLLSGLKTIRQRYPRLRLVLEIHEASLTDRDRLAHVNTRLRDLGIGVAYDDFGVGQSRLMELADVPPDFVKLDAELIEHPQLASEARRKLVKMIVEYAQERRIRTVAEGVRSDAELAFCRGLKFDLLQGFHIGHPVIPRFEP